MRMLVRIRQSAIVAIALGGVIGLAAGDPLHLSFCRDGSGADGRVRGSGQGDERHAQTHDRTAKRQAPKPELVVLRGNVVELGTHLMEKYQVPVDEDLGKAAVVLVTDEGDVHPIIKDSRSRGFFMDKRIRGRPMELRVHRYPGLPFVRVIDVDSFKDGNRHKLDYWCTICAISTFQPGPCPCCQDEIELRERPVEER